jgi:6-phosphogluconolactonase
MKGEYSSADEAAREYERDLRELAAGHTAPVPRFDLVLLGMGADGHTASLFPRTAALDVLDRLVVSNRVETLGTERLTLTVPVFNNAAQVLFLVQGSDKAEALRAVLEGPCDPNRLPAQLIRPTGGRLRWLVDPSAARLLSAVQVVELPS